MAKTNEEDWKVYVHIVPKEITGYKNDKYYIGITSRRISERWRNGSSYKTNIAFYNAIQKYGWANLKHILLMDGLTEEVAKECEIYLIAKYKTRSRNRGYNITMGGDGTKGVIPYNKGKKVDDARRELCRQARLGKAMSESAKQRIGVAVKARWQEGGDLFEKFKKTGKSPFGRRKKERYGFENKTSKRVMCIETKEIFGSACEASRFGYGNYSTICAVCRGTSKSLYKRHFKYVDDYLRENSITYDDLLTDFKEVHYGN